MCQIGVWCEWQHARLLPEEWEFDPLRPSQSSGSRLAGKPPALGAGESEFDSRDPDLKMGTRCCWRHAGPANPMDGFETHSLHCSCCRGRGEEARVS